MNRDDQDSPYIRWLDRMHAEDRPLVGGKAWNLARLHHEEIRSPPGFCVTTTASRQSLAANRLTDFLKDRGDQPAAQAIEPAAAVRTAIATAYRQLEEATGQSGLPVAVRSSAPTEDARGSSFAGQYDSFLGVVGERAVLGSVSSTWLSLFNSRLKAYASKRAVELDRTAMGVIVQQLVDAKAAGVLFTVHPVTGNRYQMVIEATYGLAEPLVSGRVAPDTYVLHKEDDGLEQVYLAEKDSLLRFDAREGKLVTDAVPENLRNAAVLDMEELAELRMLGRRLEEAFAGPQDIEWAINGHGIVVVQTRPLTGKRAQQ